MYRYVQFIIKKGYPCLWLPIVASCKIGAYRAVPLLEPSALVFCCGSLVWVSRGLFHAPFCHPEGIFVNRATIPVSSESLILGGFSFPQVSLQNESFEPMIL